MKELVCNYCGEKWYVEDESINKVNTCPFCSKLIRTKANTCDGKTIGSFQSALFNAIIFYGVSVLMEPSKLYSYIMDIAPQFKKENYILNKALSSGSARCLQNIDTFDDEHIKLCLDRFRHQLIDDEGLSEAWVDSIGAALSFSLLQESVPEILLADVKKQTIFESVAPKKDSTEHSNIASNDFDITNIDLSGIPESAKEALLIGVQRLGNEAWEQGLLFLNEGKIEEAQKKFMYLTELGFIPAFNALARIYYDKKDYKEAWKLYKRSADLGNSEGEYYTAMFYERGLNVQKNMNFAVKYYKKSYVHGYQPTKQKIEELKKSLSFEERKRYRLDYY